MPLGASRGVATSKIKGNISIYKCLSKSLAMHLFCSGILRDKTMDNIFTYILNEDETNYPFSSIKLLSKKFGQSNHELLKVPKVFKITNERTCL